MLLEHPVYTLVKIEKIKFVLVLFTIIYLIQNCTPIAEKIIIMAVVNICHNH